MTYSLLIRDPACSKISNIGSGTRKPWWANFTSTIRQEQFGQGLKFKQTEWVDYRTEMLAKHNAWYDGTHVHFMTEQDATFFVLKWS